MSGIEVVAVVAAIVSGFGASVTMFQQWKKRNADGGGSRSSISTTIFQPWKAKAPKEQEARESEIVLSESGPLVQKEYNHDVKRLGDKFAMGDDIGRSQMQSHLITLQQSIITLLTEAVTNGRSADQINLSHLMATSKSVREGSIRTLSDQFQRMSTAGSLTAITELSTKPSVFSERARRYQQYCKYAIKLQKGAAPPHPSQLACKECAWGAPGYPPGDLLGRPSSIPINTKLSLAQFSISNAKVLLAKPSPSVTQDKPVVAFSHTFWTKNRDLLERRWNIPHRFFLKCHLQIERKGRSFEQNYDGTFNHPSFGCILCEKKDKLVNCTYPYTLALHIKHEHENDELETEIDIEEL
ncbi:hypothetical protein BKA61DRAFT_738734 [Leptodontidium sp. MPI-SDFR-AT-0119]|nr:hypothetical protein BKA61DRAFT_738734 [Leptodontidium sp. MPI-SDFR-AT-0119]